MWLLDILREHNITAALYYARKLWVMIKVHVPLDSIFRQMWSPSMGNVGQRSYSWATPGTSCLPDLWCNKGDEENWTFGMNFSCIWPVRRHKERSVSRNLDVEVSVRQLNTTSTWFLMFDGSSTCTSCLKHLKEWSYYCKNLECYLEKLGASAKIVYDSNPSALFLILRTSGWGNLVLGQTWTLVRIIYNWTYSKIHPSIPFSPSAWRSDMKVSAHCEQLPQIRASGSCRWPSDVGLPVWLCCYKSYHLAGSAVISPPAHTRETHASMSGSVRAQLLLFLISLSSIVARGRFIEVRVLTLKSGRKVPRGNLTFVSVLFSGGRRHRWIIFSAQRGPEEAIWGLYFPPAAQ